MIHKFIRLLKSFHHLSSHYLRVFQLFKGFTSTTYCQNKSQVKSMISKFMDYLYLFFILKVLPTNYHLFQFDCRDRKQFRTYMDDPESPMLHHKLYECLWDEKYYFLVHDKYLFHCFCTYHNLPAPKLYGVYRNGVFYVEESNLLDLSLHNNFEKVIVKPIQGAFGKGIYLISRRQIHSLVKDKMSEDHLSEDLDERNFIVQEIIKQHPELNKINPHSVNTIRIITFLTRDDQIEFLAAILRTSSGGSFLDNFSSGGIAVGIDIETGRVKERGFLKPEYGTTVTKHPVSNIEFHHFQIPYWDQVKKTAARAQKSFHYLKSIGWDIAITPDGPVIIEGNIEWGTTGIQAANGGLLTEKNRSLLSQYNLSF